MHIQELSDQKQYDQKTAGQPHAEFLQSWQWGEFQASLGRKVLRFGATDGSFFSQAFLYPLFKKFSYLSWPRPDLSNPDFFASSLRYLNEKSIHDRPLFIRIEPARWASENDQYRELSIKSTENIQPADTLILDLSHTEEQLLTGMKAKTRYNIRLAERKGIKIVSASTWDQFEIWYDLMQSTAQRKNIRIHSKSYYRKILEAGKFPQKTRPGVFSAELVMAFSEKNPLAGNILIGYGDTITYVHGGSSDEGKNSMSTPLLQWRAIQEAKKAGYRSYDFFGIAPAENDPRPGAVLRRKKWSGITRFKEGFGGTRISYPEAKDIILQPGWYKFYSFLRTLMKRRR